MPTALKALDKGYHILLEKPISPDLGECLRLQRKAQETGRTVVVCHVLRYTPFYSSIKDLLDSGELGRLETIDAVEHVAYWHQLCPGQLAADRRDQSHDSGQKLS